MKKYERYLTDRRLDLGKLRKADGWTRCYEWPPDPDDWYVSVTSIMSNVWPKPWMRPWSMNQVVDAYVTYPAQFVWAKNAYDAAGLDSEDYKHYRRDLTRQIDNDFAHNRDIGSYIHELVEYHFTKRDEPQPFEWMDEKTISKSKKRADRFCNWIVDQGFKPFECEIPVWNEKLGYAGTLDLLMEDAIGNFVLVDLKTGSRVSNDYGAQVAAYVRATHIMYSDGMFDEIPEIRTGLIAHCKLTSDTMYSVELDEAWKVWERCCQMSVAYENQKLINRMEAF